MIKCGLFPFRSFEDSAAGRDALRVSALDTSSSSEHSGSHHPSNVLQPPHPQIVTYLSFLDLQNYSLSSNAACRTKTLVLDIQRLRALLPTVPVRRQVHPEINFRRRRPQPTTKTTEPGGGHYYAIV